MLCPCQSLYNNTNIIKLKLWTLILYLFDGSKSQVLSVHNILRVLKGYNQMVLRVYQKSLKSNLAPYQVHRSFRGELP